MTRPGAAHGWGSAFRRVRIRSAGVIGSASVPRWVGCCDGIPTGAPQRGRKVRRAATSLRARWRWAAVVQVGGGVGDAPQGRRAPFAGVRALTGRGIEDRRRRVVVGTAAFQVLTHAVQQQVTVDPVRGAEVRRVAVCTADRVEELLAGPGLVAATGVVRDNALDRPGQGGDEGGQLVALLGGQVQPGGLVAGLAEWTGLG